SGVTDLLRAAAIVPERVNRPDGRGLWQPRTGSETIGLIGRKTSLAIEEKDRLRSEAVDVLAQCLPPSSPERGRRTGLIYGRVQSGKTLSFTTVIALAHDNDIPLVVVLTGTKRNLTNQAQGRLRNDLNLDRAGVFRVWKAYSTIMGSSLESSTRLSEEIEKGLSKWRDPVVDQGARPTVLLTAKKEDDHIRVLTEALARVSASGGLSGITALLIDDECDQASLNLKVRQG